jgi:outer membrane lipoprotein-sorting protein
LLAPERPAPADKVEMVAAARKGLLAIAVLVAALLVLGAAAACSPPASAAPGPSAVPLGAEEEERTLARVADYLNGIHTMTARFTQIAQNGSVATGFLWVERPGRMRFQYDPPSPIVLLADRFYVYFIDRQLEQVSQEWLPSTPAWFLLRDHIGFGDGVIVTRFERGPASLRITVVEKEKPSLGTLTMVFGENPVELSGWTIVDAEGKTTTVSISNAQFGMALDPRLFQYQSPYPNPRGTD